MKLYFVGFLALFAGSLFPLEVKTEKTASEKLVAIMQRKSDADLASLEQSNRSDRANAENVRVRRLEAKAQRASSVPSANESISVPTQN